MTNATFSALLALCDVLLWAAVIVAALLGALSLFLLWLRGSLVTLAAAEGDQSAQAEAASISVRAKLAECGGADTACIARHTRRGAL